MANDANRVTFKARLLNTLWEEYETFATKTGRFAGREQIWNSQDIHNGKSHVWHKKNTLKFTEVLGVFACIVCSKILGIGNAERSWGLVKHLKSDKRAHLSGEAVKMQATMFGASCADASSVKRESRKDMAAGPDINWSEEDFKSVGLAKFGIDVDAAVQIPKRFFRAWMEPWEKELLTHNDPVTHEKFLTKYGGLRWYDPDDGIYYTADALKMEFLKTKKDRGFAVVGLKDSYDLEDVREEDYDVWVLCDDLYSQIVEFYEDNPDDNIVMVLPVPVTETIVTNTS